MIQTENTAIVLRHVNYRDNDRMVTLLSPSRGRIDAIIRNCRKPKSHNLNSGELFALGDYMLHERLTCGIWLLNLAEAVAEPEQEQQELFMLLLHTLSRLTFSDQEWKPLLAGFLLHFSACQGFKPRLNHCVFCGKKPEENAPLFFDAEEGGICCENCRSRRDQAPLAPGQIRWMRKALTTGSAGWVNAPGETAPFSLLRDYTERRLGRRIKSASMLPKE